MCGLIVLHICICQVRLVLKSTHKVRVVDASTARLIYAALHIWYWIIITLDVNVEFHLYFLHTIFGWIKISLASLNARGILPPPYQQKKNQIDRKARMSWIWFSTRLYQKRRLETCIELKWKSKIWNKLEYICFPQSSKRFTARISKWAFESFLSSCRALYTRVRALAFAFQCHNMSMQRPWVLFDSKTNVS